LYLAKAFSYSIINPAWPTAATAWRFGISSGRLESPTFFTPDAMAPDVTRITSNPLSINRQICLVMDRIAVTFNP
jgi:hypothetical protein